MAPGFDSDEGEGGRFEVEAVAESDGEGAEVESMGEVEVEVEEGEVEVGGCSRSPSARLSAEVSGLDRGRKRIGEHKKLGTQVRTERERDHW